jgi:hypothetical protein
LSWPWSWPGLAVLASGRSDFGRCREAANLLGLLILAAGLITLAVDALVA